MSVEVLFDQTMMEKIGEKIGYIHDYCRDGHEQDLFSAEHCSITLPVVREAMAYFREHCIEKDEILCAPYAPDKMNVGHRLHQLEIVALQLMNSRFYPELANEVFQFFADMEPYLHKHRFRDGTGFLLLLGIVQIMKMRLGHTQEEIWPIHRAYVEEAKAIDASKLDWVVSQYASHWNVHSTYDPELVTELSADTFKYAAEYFSMQYDEFYNFSADYQADFLIGYCNSIMRVYKRNLNPIEARFPFDMMMLPDFNYRFEKIIASVWHSDISPSKKAGVMLRFYSMYGHWGYFLSTSPFRGDNLAIAADRYGVETLLYAEEWAVNLICSKEALLDTANLNIVIADLAEHMGLDYAMDRVYALVAKFGNIPTMFGEGIGEVVEALKNVDNELFAICFADFFERCGYIKAANYIRSDLPEPFNRRLMPDHQHFATIDPVDIAESGPTLVKIHHNQESISALLAVKDGDDEYNLGVTAVDYVSTTPVYFKTAEATLTCGYYTITIKRKEAM